MMSLCTVPQSSCGNATVLVTMLAYCCSCVVVLLELRFELLRLLGVFQQLRPRCGAVHAGDGPLCICRARSG